MPPGRLTVGERLLEIGRQHEVFQIRLGVVGLGDPLQKLGADDAAAPPEHGDRPVVELPFILLRGGRQLHEPLGVAGDLGGIERLADLLDEEMGVAAIMHVRAHEHAAGAGSLLLHGGEAAGVDRLGDECAGHAHVECQLAHPLAGALGAGLVEDLVDDVVIGAGIAGGEDVAGDLDEIAVEFAAVPRVEHLGQLIV